MAYGFNDDRSRYDLGENVYTKDEVDELITVEGNIGTRVVLGQSQHTTPETAYTFPSDGYLWMSAVNEAAFSGYIIGANGTQFMQMFNGEVTGKPEVRIVYVRKGMKFYSPTLTYENVDANGYFYPLT